jgi:hypothetical protein
MDIFTEEKIEKLKFANEKLLIKTNTNKERDDNLIFVYCPPKVGSTSLVTSIRLFANEKFTVLHVHNERILKSLYGIDATIVEIIKYNSLLGKKIYVFDIYRTPIEKKISLFFEKLESLHFNASFEKLFIDKLIHRFNNIFPYLGTNDYYKNEYSINFPESFDFDKKFILEEKENVKYIKLRLSDSNTSWNTSLREILGIEIKIVRDYETSEKKTGELHRNFIENYKIPENLLELVKCDEQVMYYMNHLERNEYLQLWESKKSGPVEYYTNKEYDLYIKISSENQTMGEIQMDHYMDNGCECDSCREKRFKMRKDVLDGHSMSKIIHHEKEVVPNKKIVIKVIRKRVLEKRRPFRRFNFT